jgi:hypothetical protein
LGDELAELAGVVGGEGNFSCAEGGAGGNPEGGAGDVEEAVAVCGGGGEGFELITAGAVKDERGTEGKGAVIGDDAGGTYGGDGEAGGVEARQVGEALGEVGGLILEGLKGARDGFDFGPA